MRFIRAIVLFSLLFSAAIAATAQFGSRPQSQDPQEVKRQKEQQKALNEERVKAIKKDTDQLLDLANELKKSVDSAGPNTLSLAVIRKTDEIEKLAKKVREKMKETYSQPDTSRLPDITAR